MILLQSRIRVSPYPRSCYELLRGRALHQNNGEAVRRGVLIALSRAVGNLRRPENQGESGELNERVDRCVERY